MNEIPRDIKDIAKVGSFTRNAVKNFEYNIVNQKNYLEKTDKKLKDEEVKLY